MTTPAPEHLVDRTAGLQPWRRLFHALTGVLVSVALVMVDLPRTAKLGMVGAVLAGLVVMDAMRLSSTSANALFFTVFRHVASPREATGPASSTWYALGILLAVALFPLESAVSGILVLALADPAASYVGRRWGTRPFLGASLEGTALFAVVAFAILALRHDPITAAVGAVATAAVERLSWPLDDNLTVPVAGAAIVTLLEAALR